MSKNINQNGIAIHSRCLVLLVIAVVINSCANPTQERSDRAKNNDLYNVLFHDDHLNGFDKGINKGEKGTRVCFTSDVYKRTYNGFGIVKVLGANPFNIDKDRSECGIYVGGTQETTSRSMSYRYCTIQILRSGKIGIYANSDVDVRNNKFALNECYYRSGALIIGFTGSLSMKYFTEYDNSAYFLGERAFTGPIVTPIFRNIKDRCSSVSDHFYKPSLREFMRTECVDKMGVLRDVR